MISSIIKDDALVVAIRDAWAWRTLISNFFVSAVGGIAGSWITAYVLTKYYRKQDKERILQEIRINKILEVYTLLNELDNFILCETDSILLHLRINKTLSYDFNNLFSKISELDKFYAFNRPIMIDLNIGGIKPSAKKFEQDYTQEIFVQLTDHEEDIHALKDIVNKNIEIIRNEISAAKNEISEYLS